jgi:cation-transporting ATPase E
MVTAGGQVAVGGLTASQVAERVERGDVNVSSNPTSRTISSIFAENVFTTFNAVLTVCFAAVLVLGDIRDGFFYGVVIFNALIGIVQELRAKRTLDKLALVAAPEAAVLRDGVISVIPPSQVVLDDTVVLRPGDQITADARVESSTDLLLDESMLTGESDPVVKEPGDKILSGSHVVTGAGNAVVTAVGDASYASTLSAEIKRHRQVRSELRDATNRILVYLSWILVPVIILLIIGKVVAYGGSHEESLFETGAWRHALLDVVAGVVGMIPEGLVLLTSLAFGVAGIQLARERVLVQELAAVEVLARVDVLCLDKTGTLTTGEIGYRESVGFDRHAAAPAIAGALGVDGIEALTVFGSDQGANPTALALRAHLGHSEIEAERLPFTSRRAFGAVSFVSALQPTSGAVTWVLGAPERLLAAHPALLDAAHALADQGKRTLALARGELSPAEYGDDPGLVATLTPVGLAVFQEELREDARETLAFFADQGVRVVIISGDNPRTVSARAAELDLDPAFVDAAELDDRAALAAALDRVSIFGRVSPTQKRDLVHLLQERGHAVAMTGDGVNDAMAIKDADLGIAMGNATPATRAVSRVILLDSRFDKLPDVLAYGRRVIANVERVANLFLAKTVYGIVFALVTTALLWQFPFMPRQLTLVSVLAIGIPSFFLTLAPNRRRYRPGVKRRILLFSVPIGIVAAATCLVAFAPVREALPLPEARSLATIALFIVSLWILSVLARPFNLARLALVGSMITAMLLVCVIPFARTFFALTIPVNGWLLYVIAVGVAGAALIEVCYRIARGRGIVADRE